MPTKRATAEAVEGSIEKWLKISAREDEDHGELNCPLCLVFLLDRTSGACKGCPVFNATGKSFCGGTPYKSWDNHQQKKHSYSGKNLCSTCTRLARKEQKFLESLRQTAAEDTGQ